MSVNTQSLNNQERDMALRTRGKDSDAPKAKKGEKEKKSDDAGDSAKLKALEERIADAKLDRWHDRAEILKHDREQHCGDCFARGWASAVAAIEGS